MCVTYTERAEASEQVAAEIRAVGGRAMVVGADVADVTSARSMIAQTETQFGPATILVNNAGVLYQATLDTFDYNNFEYMRRVNADGIIHTTRAVMTKRGSDRPMSGWRCW